MKTNTDWKDWIDSEGTPINKGDFITTKEGRDLGVIEQTPGYMLSLKANDDKPFKQWGYSMEKVATCLRNPILSP